MATENTKRERASAADIGQRPHRVSTYPTATSRKSGAVRSTSAKNDFMQSYVRGKGQRVRRVRSPLDVPEASLSSKLPTQEISYRATR